MNHTKQYIAGAFVQLLEEKAINKITVKDIADRCDINRNTFYYHFQDIPELCEYICKQHIDELIQNHCRPESPHEAVMVASDYFIRHRTALLHIYRAIPREVFLRYLDQLALYLIGEYLDAAFAQAPRPAHHRPLLVRYYKCVLVGILLDWLDADMSYDLSQLAALLSATGHYLMETAADSPARNQAGTDGSISSAVR